MRNIITIIITTLSLAFISSAEASTLYLLCAGEMNDNSFSKSIQCGIKQVSDAFIRYIPKNNLAVYNAYADPQQPKWRGPDLLQQNINVKECLLFAIHDCPAGPDDAIIIFWIGHGARDENGHYLSLLPNQGPNKIYRWEIMRALALRNVRLVGLISDTCNVSYGRPPVLTPAVVPTPVATTSAGIPIRTFIPELYQKLFFDASGTININSSSPNQLAMVEDDGPIFTKRFSNYLIEHQNNFLLWDELIANLNKDTSQYCKSIKESNIQTICVLSLPFNSTREIEY